MSCLPCPLWRTHTQPPIHTPMTVTATVVDVCRGDPTDASHAQTWLASLFIPSEVVVFWMRRALGVATSPVTTAAAAAAAAAASASGKKDKKAQAAAAAAAGAAAPVALSLLKQPAVAVTAWAAALTAALEALASHSLWVVTSPPGTSSAGQALVAHADRLVGPVFVCVNAIVEYISAGPKGVLLSDGGGEEEAGGDVGTSWGPRGDESGCRFVQSFLVAEGACGAAGGGGGGRPGNGLCVACFVALRRPAPLPVWVPITRTLTWRLQP
jgi:hypothetical protein